MKLKLKRVEYSLDCTFGVLKVDGEIECLTLENPWQGNMPDISCIPEGIYALIKHDSPKFGNCLKVLDVDNRTEILFHKGNTASDSGGCILLGSTYGKLKEKRAVLGSKIAFDGLMAKVEDVCLLEVKS